MANAQLKSEAIMDLLKQQLSTDAGKELTKKIDLVFQINVAPDKLGFEEVTYIIDLKKGEVFKGEKKAVDGTISFKDDDFVKIATGKLNPHIAFLTGAMKINCSISDVQQFTPDIFLKPSKL